MNRLIAGLGISAIFVGILILSRPSDKNSLSNVITNADQAAQMVERIRATTTYIPVHALPPRAAPFLYDIPDREPYHEALLRIATSLSAGDPPPIPAKDTPGKTFSLGIAQYSVVGHSGGSLAGEFNSLAATSDARNRGCGWLELDTLISSDGIPFCYHDWDRLKTNHDIPRDASLSQIEAAGLMSLTTALSSFSHLILDLVHNTPEDIARILDYLDTEYPDRIRSDVALLVWKRQDIELIRDRDREIRLCFNLATWSTLVPYGEVWPDTLSDIFATTDFYVINPSKTASPDLIQYLARNGLENTFVAVMHDHDPAEIIRLAKLGVIPMLYDIRRAPVLPLTADR